MSDPERALQKLNLDDMPVTRSHTRSSQQGRGTDRIAPESARVNPIARPVRPPMSSQRSGSSTQLPTTGRSTPVGSSGTASAPSTSFIQAQALFKIEGIVTEDTHIDFKLRPLNASNGQVVERLFYDPVHGNHHAACNQSEHRRSRSPCNHITWLIASLTRELVNPTRMQPTTSQTIREQIAELYPLIARQTKSLRTRLNTFRGGETDDELDTSDDESDGESPSSSAANLFARQSELCDIITSFHDTMLPDNFRTRYAENTPDILVLENCLVENNLYATLYRLGMRDRHFYRTLQRLVPGNTRAIKYYRKQEWRAVQSLHLLDEYSQAQTLDPRTSVPECARTLREIVHEIYEDLRFRVSRSSIDQRAGEQCAACLVRLVEEVVNRRYRDFFAEYTNLPRTMPQRNRSIYAYLISEPPMDGRLESWLRDLFVIERLPQTPWVELYDRLDAIMNDIRERTRADEPLAVTYADRIGRLLQDYNQNIDDPSSSAGQHRMPRPE